MIAYHYGGFDRDGLADFDDVISLAFSLWSDTAADQRAAFGFGGDGTVSLADVVELGVGL
jgi:hypothetical protein